MTRSDKILIIGDFNIHLNKPSEPLGKAFLRLIDISNFIHIIYKPTYSSGNTLDLIISHGLDVSALNVTYVSSAVSYHSLITFEASLACPCISDTNVFTSRHISPAITVTLSDKVPGVLASLATVTKSVESLTNEVNSVIVLLLDSVARSRPRQDDQRNLLPGLLMKPEISSRPAEKWNKHGANLNWSFFYLAWCGSVLISVL